ncbi:hydrogenase small subunit [Oceanirhabdus sp. W0125-5]|uniref:hydrogenase small subunit n=1 Tax=Oceanirhabdus sp. W0125-5 TaxID=2999116 RepID=UPI0022F2FDE9|nr:hydrogenase small subunit [Oceanirhabdus sp. W0125-5]WBW95040.1 hydrogenase small subunit [Oceanirhabdus sp. W0125-5]
MKISRRSFLKWCTTSAVALGLSKMELGKLEEVVMAAETTPPVIWLQGSGCSGCSISLLNSIQETTIDDLLINKISMKYHHNIMTASGDLAISALDQTVSQYNGKFILVIEGAVPTADNGIHCVLTERHGQPWTMLDAVKELAPKASYVIAAGTCASFGGVPMGGGNPTGIQRLDRNILYNMTKQRIINLPGCPIHPYTLVRTIIKVLLYGMPRLDEQGRPREFYDTEIHDICPYKEYDEVRQLGLLGCYEELGCKGPDTYNNCPHRKWNNKNNWCIAAGHMCIGCADSSFGKETIYKFGGGSYSSDEHDDDDERDDNEYEYRSHDDDDDERDDEYRTYYRYRYDD